MKKLISSLILASLTSFSVFAETITVDNEDARFRINSGNWTPSSFVGSLLGSNYLNTGDTTTFNQV